jgi:phage shock protein A
VLAESRLQGAEGSVRARELVFGQRTAAALSDLDRVERAADLAEGQAEALTLGGDPGLAGEFAALEQQDKLDRELDALKKKRRRPAA